MPKATTTSGQLIDLYKCYIYVPGGDLIFLNIIPDITDSKGAAYNDEAIIGRSTPLKTYSHSENRVISMDIHFAVIEEGDIEKNIKNLRLLKSACYPRDEGSGGAPYTPPPICQISCGRILSDNNLCVILKNITMKVPRDVAWDEVTYLPYYFTLSTQWDVVYKSSNLPNQERIAKYDY